MRPYRSLLATGTSLPSICAALESEGRKSKRGSSSWQPMAVKRVLDRTTRTG
jgi:hypothetical protein